MRDVRAHHPAAAVHRVQHGGTPAKDLDVAARGVYPTREGGRGGRVAVRGRLEGDDPVDASQGARGATQRERAAADVSDMADAAADADARAREIEAAAEAEEGGGRRREDRGGDDRGDGARRRGVPGGAGPRADARAGRRLVALRGRAPGPGDAAPGRSSVRRGWADLDPSYMRFNPQRKPRPPSRPQSARPAKASTGARLGTRRGGDGSKTASGPDQKAATDGFKKRLKNGGPGWNASPRVRPASAGPLGRPAGQRPEP